MRKIKDVTMPVFHPLRFKKAYGLKQMMPFQSLTATFFLLLLTAVPLKAGVPAANRHASSFSVTSGTPGEPFQGIPNLPETTTQAAFSITRGITESTPITILVDEHEYTPIIYKPDTKPAPIIDGVSGNFMARIYRYNGTQWLVDGTYSFPDFGKMDQGLNPLTASVNLFHSFQDDTRYALLLGYGDGVNFENHFIAVNWNLELTQLPGEPILQSYTFYPPWLGTAPDRNHIFYLQRQIMNPVFTAASQWTAYGQGFATNYDATLTVGEVTGFSGLDNLTWTLFHNGNLKDAGSISASGGDYQFQLPNFTQNPSQHELVAQDSGFTITVSLQSIYGISGSRTETLSSFRPLQMPSRAQWDVLFTNHTNGNPDCGNQGLVSTRDGLSEYAVNYIKYCQPDIQDVGLKLTHFGFLDAPPLPNSSEDDYQFGIALLASFKNQNCNPTALVVRENTVEELFTIPLFEQSNTWDYSEDHGFWNYPRGNYVETAITKIIDNRSGLTADFPVGAAGWHLFPPANRLRLNRYPNAICGNATGTIAFFEPGSGEGITQVINPQTPIDLVFEAHFSASLLINDLKWTFLPDGGEPIVNFPVTYQNPIASCGSQSLVPFPARYSFTVPGDLLTSSGVLVLDLSLNCQPFISGTLRLDLETAPPDPVIAEVLPDLNNAPHILLNGSSSLAFDIFVNEASEPPTSAQWLWVKQNANGITHYWTETGAWQNYDPLNPPSLNQVGTGTGFSADWTFEADPQQSRIHGNGQFPFAGQVDAFFGAALTANPSLLLRLDYPQAQTEVFTTNPFSLVRETAAPTGKVTHGAGSVDGGITFFETLTYIQGDGDSLVFRFYTQDTGDQREDVRFRMVDQNGTISLPCAMVTDHFQVSFTPGQYYQLTPLPGAGVLTALNTAGRFELQASVLDCTNPIDAIQLRVRDQDHNLIVRYHFRDHLGSSSLTQTFRTLPLPNQMNMAPVTALPLAGGELALFDRGSSEAVYSPFGQLLNDNAATLTEERPRYTDHEFDITSGFNYMKGRFQLPLFAKFNRPDPMRDWDWENPSSINLYQYVRNNPINSYDPDGFTDPASAGYVSKPLVNSGGKVLQFPGNQAAAKASTKAAGRAASKFLGPIGAAIAAAEVGFVAGTYLNEVSGASDYWADKLYFWTENGFQLWSPQVETDNDTEIKGLSPSDGDTQENDPIEKNALPADPEELLDRGYEETSDPKAAEKGHRTFENPQSGDKLRFDKGKPGKKGWEGKDHYHRYNPNGTGKGDQYLDKNGKPVKRGSKSSHLEPEKPPAE